MNIPPPLTSVPPTPGNPSSAFPVAATAFVAEAGKLVDSTAVMGEGGGVFPNATVPSFGEAVASFAQALPGPEVPVTVTGAVDGGVLASPPVLAAMVPPVETEAAAEIAGSEADALDPLIAVELEVELVQADEGAESLDGGARPIDPAPRTGLTAANPALAVLSEPIPEGGRAIPPDAAATEEVAEAPPFGGRSAQAAPVSTAAARGRPALAADTAPTFSDAGKDGQPVLGNTTQGAGSAAQVQPAAAPGQSGVQPAVPSFAQALGPSVPKAQPVPAPYAAPPPPVVQAHGARMGRDIGVEIARGLNAGKEHLLIRLSPQDMGRVEVQMSFGEHGSLRAVVAAETSAALELLRREVPELARTLADAGVRTDAHSFRFDNRDDGGASQRFRADAGDGRGGQNGHEHRSGSARGESGGSAEKGGTGQSDPGAYRRLRISSQIDLMA